MNREELLAAFVHQGVGSAGFVKLVDVLGDDGSVVKAARVTTGKGRSEHAWRDIGDVEISDAGRVGTARGWRCRVCDEQAFSISRTGTMDDATAPPLPGHCLEGDRRILRYMLRHRHTSPFEFAEIVFHLRVPMDVWRQWIRHRTANVQEFSTRFGEAIDAAAETLSDAWRMQSGSNRQGSDGLVTTWPEGWTTDPATGPDGEPHADEVAVVDVDGRVVGRATSPGDYLSQREAWLQRYTREVYKERLVFGVAKEQARKDLPLSTYTEAFWKIDLHNLLHFLSLRLDLHAQLEIRQFAEAIWRIVQAWVPLTAEAFTDYRLEARTLSRQELAVVRELTALVDTGAEGVFRTRLARECDDTGVTGRERAEFFAALGVEE